MTEYRVDELARVAGTSVRNVRVYQDRGLLPPPRREGRLGWYDDSHLERLRLIGRMLERGYTFGTIGELLTAWHGGGSLADVLGMRGRDDALDEDLDEAIAGPWSEEEPEHVSRAALRRRFGPDAGGDFVTEAVRLGVLEPTGAGFRVPSPRLLDAGADLVAAGVPLPEVLGLALLLREHLDRVADLFFGVVAGNLPAAGTQPAAGQPATEPAEIVARLRPHASRVVEATFALAMRDKADEVLRRHAPHSRQSTA